jgi:hypothetical protein
MTKDDEVEDENGSQWLLKGDISGIYIIVLAY